jgi:uncharacterized membrane protein YcaP (DUF421 family)
LEKDGQVSVLKKPEFMNATMQDLNLPIRNNGIATEIIYTRFNNRAKSQPDKAR